MQLANQLTQLETAQLIRHLVEEEPAYLFKHALTQETAYESLLHTQRREIHRQVAQAIEQIYSDRLDAFAAILAQHYAKAGKDAKAFEYAARAGDVAARISAYIEARSQYDAALSALAHLPATEDNRRTRIDMVIKQVNVAWGIDTADKNLTRLFEAEAGARTLSERDRLSLAHVQYWLGRIYSYRNEHLTALSYYRQVLNAAQESNDRQLLGLAMALGARTYHLQGDFGKAVPLFQQAIPYLESIPDWQEWILAKVSFAISLAAQGHYQEGRIQGDEAIQKALALNDRGSLGIAYLMAARVGFMVGNPERMLDVVRVWVKAAEATYPLVYYMALGFQAWAESRMDIHSTARATTASAEAVAARFRTRLIFHDWFAAASAEIELNAGEMEQALARAKKAVEEAQAAGGVFSEGVAQRVWGQALAACTPPKYSEAIAHLEKSLRLFEAGEAVIEAARTRVVWGKILRERGDIDGAREHSEKAAAQFQISGLAEELKRVQALTSK